MSRRQLIALLQAPRPGTVKPRLAAALDADAAAAIHTVLIHRTIAALKPFAEVDLRFTPDDAAAEVTRWQRPGWTLHPQGEGDPGARLERATREAFAGGATEVAVVGSDYPGLATTDLEEALQALGTHDVVLGPATDGGTWLIGLRRAAPGLFQDLPWGTPGVHEAIRARAAAAGLKVAGLRPLTGVDTLEDWRNWLRTHPL